MYVMEWAPLACLHIHSNFGYTRKKRHRSLEAHAFTVLDLDVRFGARFREICANLHFVKQQ